MMNGSRFARFPALWLLVATTVTVAAFRCSPTYENHSFLPPRGDATDSGPCPHYFSLFFAKRYHVEPKSLLAGRQIDVPEYNDCQRLLVHDSGISDPDHTKLRFGNVAAVFARANINNVYRTEAAIGNAVGRSFYPALSSPNSATTRVTAIAEVWTTGPYKPLGLDSGFACIVLQWEGPVAPSIPRHYHAWMVPVANQDFCANPLDLPVSNAHYLGVQESPVRRDGSEPDEIPPVARWDWDRHRGEQYVGIACPTGWCELYGEDPAHLQGHTSSPNYTASAALNLPGQAGHVLRQKGWYDEEYLASTTPSGSLPTLDAEGAFGTVVPVPDLDKRTKNFYQPGKFVPVAWISISPSSNGYFDKYGFSPSAAPPKRPDVNAVSLCLDDGKNICNANPKHICTPTRDQTSGLLFYARVGKGPDDLAGTDFCVDFIGTNPDVSTPGTVRWRWRDDDQTIWVSCPAGCCQIRPPT